MWRIRWWFLSSNGSNYLQAPSARPGWLFPTEKKTVKGSKSSRNECFSLHTHSVLWKLGWKEKSCCPFRRNFPLGIKILQLVSSPRSRPWAEGKEANRWHVTRRGFFLQVEDAHSLPWKCCGKEKSRSILFPEFGLLSCCTNWWSPIVAAIDSWAIPWI